MNNKFKKRNIAIEGSIAFFLSIIWYLIILLCFSSLLSSLKENIVEYSLMYLLVLTLISGGFVALSWGFNKILGSYPHYEFSKPDKSFAFICPVVAIIAIVGFQGITLSFSYLLMSGGYTSSASIDFSSPISIITRSIHILLIAPICEEFLMRGTVLSSLVSGTDEIASKLRMCVVIFLNGFLFMLLHMNPLQTVYQFLFGAILAYITIKYASIVPAIIIHIINNIFGIILSVPIINDTISSWVILAFSNALGGFLFVIISIIVAVIAFGIIVLIISRFANGELTVTTTQSSFNNGFRNVRDDNGRLVGTFLFTLGSLICIVMYFVTLFSNLS